MTLIQNGRTLNLTSGEISEPCHIYVDHDRIKTIVPADGRLPPDTIGVSETLEARDQIVVPGFRNAHAHSAMVLFRGIVEDVTIGDWFNKHIWIVEQNLTPDDVYWGTLLASLEMLRAGVTRVNDHYFAMDRAFDAYTKAGMRADLASAMFGVGPDSEEGFARGVDFAKNYQNASPLVRTSLGPHSPYLCPEEFLKRTVDAARRDELPIHIHVSETADQVSDSIRQHGKTPVAHLDACGVLGPGTLLAHAFFATDDDLALIAQRGASIAHCPKTFMKFGIVTDILPRALKRGIPVGLGSDGAASNNTMSILEAARVAALMGKAATRDATAVPVDRIAPLLSSETVVAVGGTPDVVIIRTDRPHLMPRRNIAAHLVYSIQESDISAVVVGGKIVMRTGMHVSVDHAEVFNHVQSIYERLSIHHASRPMQAFS